MLKIILENIITAPERLGLPAVYAESDVLLYRQYGRYDTVAVQREAGNYSSVRKHCRRSMISLHCQGWQAIC